MQKDIPVIGVIGGIGPLATVDFMAKVVRATPASRDQDHVPMIVHHDPQIPDRTAYLVGDGVDPTSALLDAALALEKGGATMIAVPCNTAHAFLPRLETSLSIPIVNMLEATAGFIRRHDPTQRIVGLLATDGTCQSRVYEQAFARNGLQLALPSADAQHGVMEAIYGPRGVKAGHVDGAARDLVVAAIEELCTRHATETIVLGCTELPLLFEGTRTLSIAERRISLVDPTEILAQTCVQTALARRAGV